MAASLGPNQPRQVDQLVRELDLGELEFSDGTTAGPVAFRRRRGALISVAVGLVLVTFALILRPDWFEPARLLFQLATLALVLAWSIRTYRQRRGLTEIPGCVWLFANGIVGQVLGGSPFAQRWDGVTAVRRQHGQIWVQDRIVVDRSYPRLSEITARIDQATTGWLAADVRRRIGRGEAVRFGSVLVHRDGLRSADRTLPWSRVGSVVTEGETLRIRAREERGDWATVDTTRMVNTDVLQALVEPGRRTRQDDAGAGAVN